MTLTTWQRAVIDVRDGLATQGLGEAVSRAHQWQRSNGLDAVKLLADVKGVPLSEDGQQS